MLTIADLKKTKSQSQPFSKPLKSTVVAVGPKKAYQNSKGENRFMARFSIADSGGHFLGVAYDEKIIEKLKENTTILIRNFISKPAEIVLTKTTKITRMPYMNINHETKLAAHNLIHPPASPMKKIADIKNSPTKTVVSIKGQVIQDETPRTVVCGQPKRETQVRNITVKDDTDTIDVALWRDFATFEVKAGDYLEAHDLVSSSYNEQIQLSTTTRTTITNIPEPDVTTTISIAGVDDIEEQKTSLLILDNNGNYFNLDVKNQILAEFLQMQWHEEKDTLLENITSVLPMQAKITYKCNEITSLSTMAVDDAMAADDGNPQPE